MAVRDEPWPPGTPCWADIMVTDLATSQAFYHQVLGWDYGDSEEQFGGYCNALVEGRRVAGLSPTMPGMEDAPHVWSVYLATESIAGTSEAARGSGAHELFEPMAVGDYGSMGMWLDPTNAAIGAWEAKEHKGFGIWGQPGSVAWCDLMTTDLDKAKAFYSTVFGFTYQDIGMGEMAYVLFSVPEGDRPAGGIGVSAADEEGAPATWSVCFEVEDVDQAAGRVAAAGGTVLKEPYDFEFGRLVHVAGPDNETFSLIMSTPMS